jgi:hypothetical protein
MADTSERYPSLPGRHWWILRDKFKQSIPSRVTPGYLAAALDMQEKSAAANVLPALRSAGLIDAEGKPTQRAVRWRDDDMYPEVVEEIRNAIYPADLLEAVPHPSTNRGAVERWFATRTGHGLSAAKKMASFYELLFSSVPTVAGVETRKSAASSTRVGPSVAPRPLSRASVEMSFKLPGSSYSDVVKVIRGYMPFSAPVSLEEVAQATGGMHPTNISRNTGFLVSLGILEGGSKKVLTERGRRLATALDGEMPEEIQQSWRSVVAEHEFVHRIMSAVRIRGGMDHDTLEVHIAYSAGQSRSPSSLTGAATVVDVLRAADLLRESDGKLYAVSVHDVTRSTLSAGDRPAAASEYIDDEPIVTGPGVSIVVQLQIQCTTEELESIGPKLRGLLQELRAEQSAQHGA